MKVKKVMISGIVSIVMFFASYVIYSETSYGNEILYNIVKYLYGVSINNVQNQDRSSLNYDYSITSLRSALIYSLSVASKEYLSINYICDNPFCYSYNVVYITQEDIDKINDGFKKLFGIDLIKSIVMVDGPVHKPYANFIQYEPVAIETAFKRLYKKPNEKYENITYQKFYDTFFKEWMRKTITQIYNIMSQKVKFYKVVHDYEKMIKTKSFDGHNYFASKVNEFKNSTNNDVDDRILGMLVRRYIDGSIVTIFKILDRVMKDYDRQFYTKVKLTW